MDLFDPLPRVVRRGPRRAEPLYAYLNASARPQEILARLAYRTWLAHYPVKARADLVRRFRDERHHEATAFELTLHEALRCLGCDLAVPPDGNGTTRHDFDVTDQNDTEGAAAVEASLVTDEDPTERKVQRRADQVLDGLDARPHPRMAVHVWECRVGSRQPSSKRLRRAMHEVLDAASDRDVASWAGSVAAWRFDLLPRWVYEEEGTRLVWSPVPRPPGDRTPSQIVQLPVARAMERVSVGEAVLAKVRKKAAKRYTVGERPLVLALGVTHWAGSDDFEIFRAVLGTERWHVDFSDGKPVAERAFRDRDGTWSRHGRHAISSISALLVFRRFRAWAPWATTWRVYVNPIADVAPPGWLLRLPRWVPEGTDVLRLYDGAPLDEVLRAP